jgi:sulfur relay (sulfurtransferase) complex TusBCD TusD component (DsrE family)
MPVAAHPFAVNSRLAAVMIAVRVCSACSARRGER